jgi:RND family efflux transporter MFP subunit
VFALLAVAGIAAFPWTRSSPAQQNAAAAAAQRSDAAKTGAASPEGEGESGKPSAYPVVTVAPVQRAFKQLVRAYGMIQADARKARSIASPTVGVVRSVEVVQGERVKEGQVLLTLEPDPLAYLAYRQAVSAEKLARAEVARLTVQRADNLATATQVETAEKALADAEAGVEAARRQGAAAGAEVLRAPADGIVTAIGAGVGDRPPVGTVLAAVAPLSAVIVTLGAEPGEARLVHVGDVVRLRLIQGVAASRTGHVKVVGAALDKTTRLITLIVSLDEPGFADYPAGSAVEGEIEARAVEAFSLPRAAIVQDEEGTAVFEVKDGKAHRVPVTIEVDQGQRVGVSGELDPKRPVVTTGAYELEDGVTVTGLKP